MRLRHSSPAAAAAVAIAVMIASGSGAAAAAGSTSTDDPPAAACGGLRPVAPVDPACTHGGDPVPTDAAARSSAAAAAGPTPAAPCPGDGVSGKRVRVMYGYPKDTVNRVSSKRSEIREAVSLAGVNLDEATPGTPGQHYRAYCAKDSELTVTAVKLKAIGRDGKFGFSAVISSLVHQKSLGLGSVNYRSGRFDYVVFVDNISCCYLPSGQGTLILDDRAAPSLNWNNQTSLGAKYALVRLGYPSLVLAEIFQHEVGHNLGAVQYSAAHSSLLGHCYDESDIMCYADGGPYFTGGGTLTSTCVAMPSGLPVWDCGGDDYYDDSPTSGSYLDEYWNLADSGWLSWTA
jgi:hypothetical protein